MNYHREIFYSALVIFLIYSVLFFFFSFLIFVVVVWWVSMTSRPLRVHSSIGCSVCLCTLL